MAVVAIVGGAGGRLSGFERRRRGRIGEYVKPWLRELVERMVPREPVAGGIGTHLLERAVRVEEELKAQRELMNERFALVERRFEAADERFTALSWTIGTGFTVVATLTTIFALLG